MTSTNSVSENANQQNSEQSAALHYAITAEKKSMQFCSNSATLNIDTVGIIGGGTMGIGICTSFLKAGITIFLIEQNEIAAQAAYENISNNFTAHVQKGKMSQITANRCLNALTTTTDKSYLANCQLIIEAIFEDIDAKKALFKELDAICKETTLLATNTSYLDINEIAESTQRPDKVIGMHFFSPAHIMKLLEVVQTEKSSDLSIATAMKLGEKLGKVAVLVKVCFGFAGNRMYSRYGREIQQMLLEGAKVGEIDQAMLDWGMAMGPLAVQDLSGIDIGYQARKSRPFPEDDPGFFKAAAILVENGRLGRKTQAGFYRYDINGKSSIDPDVDRLICSQASKLGIPQRKINSKEIVHRALYAIISEAFQLFEDGIVQRSSDIDVIWLLGYGFPRFRGGPMFQAQKIGVHKLADEMNNLRQQFGVNLWPEINYDI